MVKIVVTFDSYYDVGGTEAQSALGQLKAIKGVQAIRALRALEGKPAYCVEVEVEDADKDAVLADIERFFGYFQSYVSNRMVRVYKQVAQC